MSTPVIIVTGASRGIGLAIAEELQARGAIVVGVARKFCSLAASGTFLPLETDVTDSAARSALIATTIERFGRIDGLVNNAGQTIRTPAAETTLEDFRRILEVNLLAVFELSRLAYPHLKETRGSIVNISSAASQRVLPPRVAYSSSKAALDHLTHCLAAEWGPDGIRVNAVLPWFTRTEMTEGILQDQSFMQSLLASVPLRRIAEPADVARAVAFLVLPGSDYISGQLIAVDGGYLTMGR